MSDYCPDQKVYTAQGGQFSVHDLMRRFADPELEFDGMPRISDLHLKVGEPVRYRYDGDLETVEGGEVLTDELIHQLVFPLLSKAQRTHLTETQLQDVDASYFWREESINFRLNVFHDRDGIACVIRMLPRRIPAIDTLGFLGEEVWQELVTMKHGLVLVTGGTGNGKSTTIASLIDHINKTRKCRIITLEDPVEYVFQSQQALISQRELGSNLSSFAGGLKSALRESPDIIYVGEIRDAETASLALTAAETGHLVFSTLHTMDAKGAISRIVDLFPSERSREVYAQMSYSLAFSIGQKLLHRKDDDGRVPVFEVLKNTAGMANIIRTGKLHQVISKIQTSSNEGMHTLEKHLLVLLENDQITAEDALLHANDSNFESQVNEWLESKKQSRGVFKRLF